MLRMALRMPVALGVKVIVNVLDPPGVIGLNGRVDRIKSEEWVPDIATSFGEPVRFRLLSPVLWIVKVRLTALPANSALPKSVKSELEGVMSPLEMDIVLPLTSISGDATPFP